MHPVRQTHAEQSGAFVVPSNQQIKWTNNNKNNCAKTFEEKTKCYTKVRIHSFLQLIVGPFHKYVCHSCHPNKVSYFIKFNRHFAVSISIPLLLFKYEQALKNNILQCWGSCFEIVAFQTTSHSRIKVV